MINQYSKFRSAVSVVINTMQRAHHFLQMRSVSILILFALVCTLSAKLYQSIRMGQLAQYPQYILADIAVLLTIEAALSVICYLWPRRFIFRIALVVAAAVGVWSFLNAGWLLRTGKQFLPLQAFPLIRDPFTCLALVAINIIKMPLLAIPLIVPAVPAIAFLIAALARPRQPAPNYRRFIAKTLASAALVIISLAAYTAAAQQRTAESSHDLFYNSQLKSVTSSLLNESLWQTSSGAFSAIRTVPNIEQTAISAPVPEAKRYNIVVIVLEGIQYRQTSLSSGQNNLTPYLKKLADEGVEFSNARTSFTHTTKALFALLTGRYPSPSQDVTESIPVDRPFVSLASVLKAKLQYRTAFFLSAKGDFESGPGLVYNLGFDDFWARENLRTTNNFIGYQNCDEFAMLPSMTNWIKNGSGPFLLVATLSVSHDPYIVPNWFAAPAKDHLQRYRQTINYTDSFIKAFDAELERLNLKDDTIFCVIGDHGEGFGEHGQFAHEGIGFEETTRIPWILRTPNLAGSGSKITAPVGSVDLTPTLLTILGFDTNPENFDGINVLGQIAPGRKVFFICGMYYGPTGYAAGNMKYFYDEVTNYLSAYDLAQDPLEKNRLVLPAGKTKGIIDEIKQWRNAQIFAVDKNRKGKRTLYNNWLITWSSTICRTKFVPTPAFVKSN